MSGQGKTLADKVAQELLALIRERNYAPGDRLPTEKALCERTGAGRNTVREALKLLASRNVVTIRQGAGTYVSDKQGVADDPLGFAMVSDPARLTRELIQVRVILEPPIAALAAQCASQEDILALRSILEKMEARMERREDFAPLDQAFHVKIAECTHNTVMGNLIPIIGKGVSLFARTVGETEYSQTLLAHRKIYQHIAGREPFEAELEMRGHLLFNRSRYLRELEEKEAGKA